MAVDTTKEKNDTISNIQSMLGKHVFRPYLNVILNDVPLYFLCPLVIGVPPGGYYLHHLILHHSHNNHAPYDISATEHLDRTSIFTGLLPYMGRMMFLLPIELPVYSFRLKRYDWFVGVVLAFVVYYLAFYSLSFADYGPSLIHTGVFVMILPHYLCLMAMSFGNFHQHIFVTPEIGKRNVVDIDPAQRDPTLINSELAITFMNTPDNQVSLQDGYHTTHHYHPRLHWSQLPHKFLETLEKCRGVDTVINNSEVAKLKMLDKSNPIHKDYDSKGSFAEQNITKNGDILPRHLEGLRSAAFVFQNTSVIDMGFDVANGNFEKIAREHFIWTNGPPGGKPFHKDEYVPTIAEVSEEMIRRLGRAITYATSKGWD